DPAAVVVIKVAGINWAAGSANLAIDKVLVLDPPGTPSILPLVEEVNALQPVRDWGCALRPKRSTSQEVSQNQEPCCIASWIQPRFTQGHGPSFLPGTPFMYLTLWTDNRIRVLDSRTNTFAATDPQSFHEYSDQTHGVNCNASGTYCLGTGYFYDQNEIEVYLADPDTGGLNLVRSIELCEGKGNKCAALTHYTAWLDDRFALTATMQFGPTSLTPPRSKIIGPSVWLLDVYSDRGVQTIGTASGRNAPGIFRSASDLQVVGDKLYVAEEDTLDGSFGDDGYISVFDISNLLQPRFLKRFKPGEELPNDYCISHGMNVTPDGQFLYVTSYACSYIVKIDTTTDEVVKIYGAADGLNGPHGAFIAGQQR
ncbi:MAG: hypothetical protein OEU26_36310, partial [Candidatus Tectomicrobia bacterium]|nr:hypothetical protein [Candidatus Tectomicrobia bacterium]